MQKAGSAPTLPALLYFQEKDADHIYSVDREDPSRIVYYPTGRPGAGTEGYSPPSPPWAPKPASRQDGPPPVRTEKIINDTQKTSYFPAWNKRFYFLCFIDSIDTFHPFRRNFDRSFIFTADNISLLFQVQLGSRCHQAESAYPTIKVTQVFSSSPCLGILFSRYITN